MRADLVRAAVNLRAICRRSVFDLWDRVQHDFAFDGFIGVCSE